MSAKETYTYKYPRPSVTTDCVIFGYDEHELKVLLIERGNDPYKGCWAFPGGFLNMDEEALTGAKRELQEETGLEQAYIEQFYTFSDVDRDPRGRVISIAYLALVKIQEVKGGDDATQAKWFSMKEIPPLAFDHKQILYLAINRLKEKIFLEPILFELLPETFTLLQLQHIYECILGEHFDIQKFTNKLLDAGILENTNRNSVGENCQNSTKYRFNKKRNLPFIQMLF